MVQSHEPLLIQRTYFTFVSQCEEFEILIFNETVLIMDILIRMTFMLSFFKNINNYY